MKKENLLCGDIVVTLSGMLGIVIVDDDCNGYIVFQYDGADDLDNYDENLVYMNGPDEEPDSIMQVYRASWPLSFLNYDDVYPRYERDVNWFAPTQEEMRKSAEERESKRNAELEQRLNAIQENKENRVQDPNLIFVVAQQFYGNRTGTEIERDKVDYFLHGHLDYSFKKPTTDLKIVHVPGSEHVVIVYDQLQEDNYVNVKFPDFYKREGAEYKEHTGKELTMHVSCEIPELNFKIHTRCFACRIDHNGVLQSLAEGDGKFIEKYLTL